MDMKEAAKSFVDRARRVGAEAAQDAVAPLARRLDAMNATMRDLDMRIGKAIEISEAAAPHAIRLDAEVAKRAARVAAETVSDAQREFAKARETLDGSIAEQVAAVAASRQDADAAIVGINRAVADLTAQMTATATTAAESAVEALVATVKAEAGASRAALGEELAGELDKRFTGLRKSIDGARSQLRQAVAASEKKVEAAEARADAVMFKRLGELTTLLKPDPAAVLKWRGVYDPAGVYAVGSLVMHKGTTWIATRPSQGEAPAVMKDSAWAIFAAGAVGV